MTRPLRLDFPGALYHVTARGDRREPIVEDDADRLAWVDLLGRVARRFGWRVQAWVLMSNHYHLVLETPDARLSEGMRQLNGVWSQAFNRRHGRVGHVFQGRFKAIFVERESFLLELARYVVLNPVRARMVNDAADYAWSSHGAMMGRVDPVLAELGEPDGFDWLDTAALLRYFASDANGSGTVALANARERYRNFVRAGVGLAPVWETLQGQVYLGSDAFRAGLQARLSPANLKDTNLPKAQRHAPPPPLTDYVRQLGPASAAMAAAYATGAYSMGEVARAFGVAVSTVSRAVRQHERERSIGTD